MPADEPREDGPAASLAVRLATWSAALAWADVPEGLKAGVTLWLLDTLGVMLAACEVPAGRAVLGVARAQGGPAESTLVGAGERVAAAWAALAHGTLAHSLDFDDTLATSVVHPGSVVVPTALAAGEAAGRTGSDVLAAIAAGYEIVARLGAAAGRGFHARGLHATGVVGPLAAAAVAAKLYGLSPGGVARAMGIAGSMGGGLLEFLSDGSWAKRLHPGWAAHGGVLAAQLAGTGFTGPVSVLEGRHGLYAAFLGPGVAGLDVVTRDLGREWLSRDVLAKLYPCAHAIHPFVDAALSLRPRPAIAAVQCRVAPWQVPIVCEPREAKIAPATEYQARASLPFAVAAALVDGRVDLDTFTPDSIRRPEVLALAARVTCVEDAGAGAGFAGELEVETEDGRRLAARATAEPVDPARVRAKFEATAGRFLSGDTCRRLADAVGRLEASTPAELLALCRHDATSSRRPGGSACPPTDPPAGSP